MQNDSKQDQSVVEPGMVFSPSQPSVPTPTPTPTASIQPSIPPKEPQRVVAPPVLPTSQPPVVTRPPEPVPLAVVTPPPTQNIATPQTVPVASPAKPTPVEVEQPVLPPSLDTYQDYNTDKSLTSDVNFDAPHVEWTASEYTANPKSGGWFGLLALATLVVAAAVYLLTSGDIVSTVVIVVIAVIFGVFAARQPQILNYAIDNEGFHIGPRFYPYEAFKSFSVMHEGSLGYISLLPLKRFMPPLTIHYDPNDEEQIANTLMEYLPFEEHKTDIVDAIARKFRF